LATAFLFGLAPAFRGSRVPASATLKEEAGSVTGGHSHVRLRKTFVALQVGLSSLLLIGAGLFVRTLDNLRHVSLGFQVENVAMFGVRPATQYDDARKLRTIRSLMEGLATVPGVKAVGANTSRLLTGGRWDSQISIPGVEIKEGNVPWSFFNAVTPGYFEALGIPIKMGRDFSWRDWGGSRKLCLVNEALVKQYLDGANAVGRQMGQGRSVPADIEIIGVFGDARYHDVRGEVPRQTFVNLDGRIRFVGSVTVYARIQGDPRRVMPMLREQVRRVDSNLVVFDMRTLDEQLNMRLANERMLSYSGGGGAARRPGVCRHATHSRDRHSHGFGSHAAWRDRPGHARDAARNRRRFACRRRGRHACRTLCGNAVVRRTGARCRRVRGQHCRAANRLARRVLPARVARLPDRADARAAV
jgi:hypothetical protein